MTTLYYDPVLDVHHRLPVSLAMTTAYYAMPQHPKDARRLFDAACAAMGLDRYIETTLNPESQLWLRPGDGQGVGSR